MLRFPLYCPKCKAEIRIDVMNFELKVSAEPDAQKMRRACFLDEGSGLSFLFPFFNMSFSGRTHKLYQLTDDGNKSISFTIGTAGNKLLQKLYPGIISGQLGIEKVPRVNVQCADDRDESGKLRVGATIGVSIFAILAVSTPEISATSSCVRSSSPLAFLIESAKDLVYFFQIQGSECFKMLLSSKAERSDMAGLQF